MSLNGIKACTKYQLKKMLKSLVYCAIWIFAIIFSSAFLNFMISGGELSFENISMNCIDSVCGFVIFIMLCSNTSDFVNTAAANGVSRLSSCVSLAASSVVFSLVGAIESSVICPLISIITGQPEIWAASIYGTKNALEQGGMSDFAIRVRFFLVSFIIYSALAASGALLASISYRVPKWVSVTIIILIFFIPTFGINITFGDEALISFWLKVITAAGISVDTSKMGNLGQGTLFFLAAFLIMFIITALLLRRSSVKPLALKEQ